MSILRALLSVFALILNEILRLSWQFVALVYNAISLAFSYLPMLSLSVLGVIIIHDSTTSHGLYWVPVVLVGYFMYRRKAGKSERQVASTPVRKISSR